MLKVQSFFDAIDNNQFVHYEQLNIETLNNADYIIIDDVIGNDFFGYEIRGYMKEPGRSSTVWMPFVSYFFKKNDIYIFNKLTEHIITEHRMSSEKVLHSIKTVSDTRVLLLKDSED